MTKALVESVEKYKRLDILPSEVAAAIRAALGNQSACLTTLEPDSLGLQGAILVRSPDVVHALNLFLEGKVMGEHLTKWAEDLIMSDVFEFSPKSEGGGEILKEVMHRLANPEINNSLSESIVHYYKSCIDSGISPSL